MKKRRTSSGIALVIFFINSGFFLSNQVNIFVGTLDAKVEDIFVSFVITKHENNYDFVLSSLFSHVTSKL